MHEILHNLSATARALDLGSGAGSFDKSTTSATVIRADLDPPPSPAANFAQADAALLPFPDRCFDAVISNHSLEHFENLTDSLHEIARVLKPGASLFVAVPDASTFCDHLYRWLARGGGHLNAFRSAPELALLIETATGLPHVATRTLCTSFSYLNRANRRAPAPRRLWLLGGGTPASLHLLSFLCRLSDRLFHTRASVYGWALYFGRIDSPMDTRAWTNVCLRCGSGVPSDWLAAHPEFLCRLLLLPAYRCPSCGARNLRTHDQRYPHFASAPPTPGL